VLEEADAQGASTTTFTVEPAEDGAEARVTIQTRFRPRRAAGHSGADDDPRGALRIYRDELARLDAYAQSSAVAAS
jgi:hypothetical protein